MVAVDVNTITQEAEQSSRNEIYQDLEATCAASCEQTQAGNVIVIEGSNVGDVLLTQTCDVEASCVIDQTVESILDLIQDIQQDALAGDPLPEVNLNLLNTDINTITQKTRQEQEAIIRQSIESNCLATSEQIQEDNIIYVRNSTTGDIGLVQESNVVADCIMTNLARADIQLKQKGDQIASAGTFSGALVAAIVAAIIIVIVIVAITTRSKKKRQAIGRRARRVRRAFRR